jgi:hypothetical protein
MLSQEPQRDSKILSDAFQRDPHRATSLSLRPRPRNLARPGTDPATRHDSPKTRSEPLTFILFLRAKVTKKCRPSGALTARLIPAMAQILCNGVGAIDPGRPRTILLVAPWRLRAGNRLSVCRVRENILIRIEARPAGPRARPGALASTRPPRPSMSTPEPRQPRY